MKRTTMIGRRVTVCAAASERGRARPSRASLIIRGIGQALSLLPDNRGRLSEIHPYSSPQDAIHRDGQRIAKDMQAVLARVMNADHG